MKKEILSRSCSSSVLFGNEYLISRSSSESSSSFEEMGQGFSGLVRKKSKKRDKNAPKPPPPVSKGFGHWKERRKERKGAQSVQKLPHIPQFPENRLKHLKTERIKDWVLMEEELLKGFHAEKKNTASVLNQANLTPAQIKFARRLRKPPLIVADLEDIVDDNHAIVSLAGGRLPFYVPITSIVDRDRLEPNGKVLLSKVGFCVVGVLDPDDTNTGTAKLRVEKAPKETFADIGGLDAQILEVREVIEVPLTRPELFLDMGITPQKGVILYGPPGTGKTLLAKAVANSTKATFIKVSGSELVRKTMGEGPKLVRDIFRMAEENAPSIVFIDEVDAIGGRRTDGKVSDGEKEIQRTLLELLNQLDGFDRHTEVKIIMATNRIDCLDPALIRPGRIDRKIEVPLPTGLGKKWIFDLHSRGLNLDPCVSYPALDPDESGNLSGADIEAICSGAGINALRARRRIVTMQDFLEAKKTVLYKKREGTPHGLYV